ncbi:MAG TPA: cyclic nucleotide-binding domain-containing protein, partial [Methylibium sp.]|nr:cyclic nucleotide-binding domain-containing protein [Methylibium sp.]
MRQRYQEELLDRCLHAVLGELEPEALALLRERLRWLQIGAGEVLMTEGEAGDSMYLVVSGRLRAYLRDADGAERAVREMGRGQVVGEMALYTDAPRSATVAAVRDTVLVQLAREDLRALLAHSAQLSIALTRQLIRRLDGQGGRTPQAPPVTVALVPVSAGVDAHELAARLAGALGR